MTEHRENVNMLTDKVLHKCSRRFYTPNDLYTVINESRRANTDANRVEFYKLENKQLLGLHLRRLRELADSTDEVGTCMWVRSALRQVKKKKNNKRKKATPSKKEATKSK